LRPAVLLLLFLFVCVLQSRSQVIISLVLGDKLNSGTIEFGLEGGVNFPTIKGLEGKAKSNFNLGFYFDIKTKNPSWLVHTGVMVKSSLGTAELPVYLLNDAGLDSSFKNGEVNRRINYFNCPLQMKYKFTKNIFAEAGIMPSLRSAAHDIFHAEPDGNDLEYKKKISDDFHRIDFGLIAGFGYRLMGGNGMNLSVQYYYGLTNILVDDKMPAQYNRSLFLFVGIPIGAGKAREREKNKLENEKK
jgi:hypothetical protein